jgi:hypothetical protein
MSRNRRMSVGMLASWQPNWSTCAAVYVANTAPRSHTGAGPRDVQERSPDRTHQSSPLPAYQPAAG